jgi:hypothetical protein
VSYLDENGIEHVSGADKISAWANAHVACCPKCAGQWGTHVESGILPSAETVDDALLKLELYGAVVLKRPRKGPDVTPR